MGWRRCPFFKNMKKSTRRRIERLHLAICRLFVAQKRAVARGAPRLDYWGDLDEQTTASPEELRPSFLDMANALEAVLEATDDDSL